MELDEQSRFPQRFAALVLALAAACHSEQEPRTPSALTDPFRAALPTMAWEQRMKAGDDMFTPAAIAASKARLGHFLDQVDRAAGDSVALREVFRSVVEDFDRLNTAHSSLIETMEREELAQWINALADAAKLDRPNGDITEEWRTNW